MSAPTLRPQCLTAGEGKEYDWSRDHIFVKLTGAGTGGLCTLIQDNLKPGFDLALHLHRQHTEIFYVLEGQVEFTVGARSFTAAAGAVVYVPPGTPHAARSDQPARMLMFYAPGGIEGMFAELGQLTPDQSNDRELMAAINDKYDNVVL